MNIRLFLILGVIILIGLACSGESGNGPGDTDTNQGDTNNPQDTSLQGDTASNSGTDSNSSGNPGDTDSLTGDTSGSDTNQGDTNSNQGDTSNPDTSVTDTSAGTDSSSDTATIPGDTSVGDTGSDTLPPDTGVAPDTSDTACVPVPCGSKYYKCADCIDNDSDGLLDAADPDCLGPCDNNEEGFNIDIPGSAPSGCTMDCYFDADNGSGNDQCEWDFTCDTYDQLVKLEGNKTCPFNPSATAYCDGLKASQAETCGTICEPLVPNGCDCWGCCKIGTQGEYRYVGTPGCSLESPENCDPCTPVPSCENECSKCELCIGMTSLPPECLTAVDTDPENDTDTVNNPNDTDTTGDTSDDTSDDPVFLRCSDGRQPCGQPGDANCSAGLYCITGCCTPIILN